MAYGTLNPALYSTYCCKGDNLSMIAVTGGFKYLFGNDLPVVRDLRNLGLDLTDAATPIKNRIIRRAAGLEGDLPRLARKAH